MTSFDVRLKRADRVYRPGEVVSGLVVVVSKSSVSHGGITLAVEGVVTLQLSSKSVGVFEAFYSSVKPITMLATSIEVSRPGRIPEGTSELPFEFRLTPTPGQTLYETYHGVFVNVTYTLRCDMRRTSLLSKDLNKTLEFVVEVPPSPSLPAVPAESPTDSGPVQFRLTPESLAVARKGKKQVPDFEVVGRLDTAVCDIRLPLTGDITVARSEAVIKSVELQLVRVETCGCADGFAKETTEIQNIQIAEGDVARGIPLRLHMVFPRLFTCPSVAARTFKLEFEVNLVVMFEDNYLVTESFPIKLVRTN